jgi:hypothetical protein
MRPRAAAHGAASLLAAVALFGCWTSPDSVAGASLRAAAGPAREGGIAPGAPLIVTPSDQGGAARLAAAMAARLHARVASPSAVAAAELEQAGLIGLGSGIFDQAHHKALLALAEALPPELGRKVFLFSTSGVSREKAPGAGAEDPHKALRDRLLAKGCLIVGEYNCVGFNDNSFLYLFGGMNRGHPDARDIALAESFADSLMEGGAGCQVVQ